MTLCSRSDSKVGRRHECNEHTLDRVVMININRMKQALGDGIHAQDIVHQRGILMMEEELKWRNGGRKEFLRSTGGKGAYKFLSNVRVANVRNFFWGGPSLGNSLLYFSIHI